MQNGMKHDLVGVLQPTNKKNESKGPSSSPGGWVEHNKYPNPSPSDVCSTQLCQSVLLDKYIYIILYLSVTMIVQHRTRSLGPV